MVCQHLHIQCHDDDRACEKNSIVTLNLLLVEDYFSNINKKYKAGLLYWVVQNWKVLKLKNYNSLKVLTK